MRRLLLLFRNEVRLVRAAVPIHLLAVLQPAGMFLLLGLAFFTPTFDVEVAAPATDLGRELVAAMEQVRSPELPYIRPVVGEGPDPNRVQRVSVESPGGVATAVHRFALVDGNTVKNHRNRLTAAQLRMWDARLGGRAVRVVERPWLPRDVPFLGFIGMAMLPLGAFASAAFVGAFSTAQDFERRTILEYRLSPVPWVPVVAARVARLLLVSMTGVALMIPFEGAITGIWPAPAALPVIVLALLGVAFAGSCVGVTAGLAIRQIIPSFLAALVASLLSWILGCAFGLPGIFGRAYETVGALSPNTHAVKLMFPAYYGVEIGPPLIPAAALALECALLGVVVLLAWRRSVFGRG